MNKTYADIVQFLKFVKANLLTLAGIIVVITGGFFILTKLFVATKYKAFTIVTIPTRYFQQPAVEDIIPAVQDPGEMRTLREGLLTSTINRDYLEKIRADYKLFEGAEGDAKKYEANMQKLKAQFEILSLDLTSFQVGFIGPTTETTLNVAVETQNAIINHLSKERSNKLTDLRNNLLAKIDSLGLSVNRSGDTFSASRPESLQNELQQVRGLISSLGSRYTLEHPTMVKYKAREKLILNWLASHNLSATEAVTQATAPLKPSLAERKEVQGLSSSSLLEAERYADLLKRVDILNIVIDYESSDSQNLILIKQQPIIPLEPINPKMKLVLFWGLLTSLIASALYLTVKNQMELAATEAAGQSHLNPRIKADFLDDVAPAATITNRQSTIDQV